MKLNVVFLFTLIIFFVSCEQQNNNIDLTGEWNFQMDTEDVGIIERWFETDLRETIVLPGSMVENGKGF
ncbi:MAG: hypothetical protein HOG79_03135, partial [Prolixibacteraceae bacterium]|nr:hypothetical protein [Prolixibacteraceae bacterium]